jgi:16S rRNA (uracil1498-N3)-methyltransferase
MTPPLFLVDELPHGDTLLLGGEEGRHAARVKRLAPGEPVLVGDGLGGVLDCVVEQSLADGLLLRILSRHELPEPRPRLVAVQALPKGDRAELAVELLTELGADEIVPWAAARSVAQWRDERAGKALAKWRRTAREAGKQSRRARLPMITDLASTEDVTQRISQALSLVLHEEATLSLASAELPAAEELVVVIGPEGGVTDKELAVFTAAGARAVRLGEPVLRTSTAGAAALAVLSARLGRWG